MARADGRRRPTRVPARQDPPQRDEEENSDITGALRQARAGSAQATAALDSKTKKTAVTVALVLSLFTGLNIVANVYLYSFFQEQTLDRAEANRLNGAAQEQARQALEDAGPANARLKAEGLFVIDISPPTQSPASDVIANSASAQVLADMPRDAIVTEDYVALGAASKRYYDKHPTITQSGPTPLKVNQLCQQYLAVARRLVDQKVIPGAGRPR